MACQATPQQKLPCATPAPSALVASPPLSQVIAARSEAFEE